MKGEVIVGKTEEKVKKSALDIIEVSKELLEKSDITINEKTSLFCGTSTV